MICSLPKATTSVAVAAPPPEAPVMVTCNVTRNTVQRLCQLNQWVNDPHDAQSPFFSAITAESWPESFAFFFFLSFSPFYRAFLIFTHHSNIPGKTRKLSNIANTIVRLPHNQHFFKFFHQDQLSSFIKTSYASHMNLLLASQITRTDCNNNASICYCWK